MKSLTTIMRGRKILRIIFWCMFIGFMIIMPYSCTKNDEPITEAIRYSREDVKSYADLFEVFWTTMNDNYNYFYEEKQLNDMDWGQVYDEYYPKFAALKSWDQEGYGNAVIKEEALTAEGYFDEIVSSLLDRHFYLEILLPYSSTETRVFSFRSGEKEIKIYNKQASLASVFTTKLDENRFFLVDNGSITSVGGFLQSNPDVYYFSFNGFSLNSKNIDLKEKDLLLRETQVVPSCYLYNKEGLLSDIKSQEFRVILSTIFEDLFSLWKEALTQDIQPGALFNEGVVNYNNSGILESYMSSEASTILNKISDTEGAYTSMLISQFYAKEQEFIDKYGESDVQTAFQLMDSDFFSVIEDLKTCFNFTSFEETLNKIITSAPLYDNFYNLLIKGEIKKLVLDLRGNGGGSVVDFRYFTERFVTKETVFMFLRHKEGNGRFNYTPWIPQMTKPHEFAIPDNFPIVILTDKGSASMSELSTLMLKSQGEHVKSVGDYSAGATAGLTGSDEFNGGLTDVIPGLMYFYMPAMATKDITGKVIEGIGVEPDVFVTPPTEEEIEDLLANPNHNDKTLEKSIEVISGM